jgi:hypothetical protein
MVEPGVTFGEIQAKLAKSGLSAYLPLAPRSSKSVIGSMLEREIPYMITDILNVALLIAIPLLPTFLPDIMLSK